MQPESLRSIGQASTESETSEVVVATTLSESTLFAEDSHAKTFPTPDEGQELKENEADCFSRPFAWFANYDRESLCWRTWQRCLLEGWTEFSGRWPRSGLMRNGIAYRLPPLVPRISGTERLYWVTPTAVEGRRGSKPGRPHDTGYPLAQQVLMPHRWPTPTARDWKAGHKLNQEQQEKQRTPNGHGCQLNDLVGGSLNPQWVEWLMGFPDGWTDLEDLETQ